jgi:hypothetical protein
MPALNGNLARPVARNDQNTAPWRYGRPLEPAQFSRFLVPWQVTFARPGKLGRGLFLRVLIAETGPVRDP